MVADHSGHRQRLRERLNRNPGDLADYELLELLLTYILPRKDTKPLAKALLQRFGSLADVLTLAPEKLTQVPGLGDAAMTFWTLWQECQIRRSSRPLARKDKFTSPEQVGEMVCARLGHLSKEEFWILLVDNQNRLIAFEPIASGTVDQTAAYPREILETALKQHASGLILVHNHPGGDPNPSPHDRKLTETIASLSKELGIRLLDHLIVTGNTFSSFRSQGLL